MASTIILSDNGASSGSAGLKQTAGNDGVLILQTTTSGGTATNAIYVDTSQNVGLGTSSPVQRLDVVSSNTDVFQAIRSTSSSPTNVALRLQDATTGTANNDGAYLGRASSINYLWTYENEPWVFGTNSTERMRINAGAPILCLSGGNTSATGTGIAFPATQSASSDANTLDDYEEGTFTPTFLIGGSSGTVTTAVGYYRKIGSFVTAWVYMNGAQKGALTGNVEIGNLPFASLTGTDTRIEGAVGYFDGMASNQTFITPISGDGPATKFGLYGVGTGATSLTNLTNSSLSSSTNWRMVVFWHTA